MRKLIAILALLALTGCSYRAVQKGDLSFKEVTLFQKNTVEGLVAESAQGDKLSINKHNAEARQELLKSLLEAML